MILLDSPFQSQHTHLVHDSRFPLGPTNTDAAILSHHSFRTLRSLSFRQCVISICTSDTIWPTNYLNTRGAPRGGARSTSLSHQSCNSLLPELLAFWGPPGGVLCPFAGILGSTRLGLLEGLGLAAMLISFRASLLVVETSVGRQSPCSRACHCQRK